MMNNSYYIKKGPYAESRTCECGNVFIARSPKSLWCSDCLEERKKVGRLASYHKRTSEGYNYFSEWYRSKPFYDSDREQEIKYLMMI